MIQSPFQTPINGTWLNAGLSDLVVQPPEFVWEITPTTGGASVIRSPSVNPILAVTPGDSSATVQV